MPSNGQFPEACFPRDASDRRGKALPLRALGLHERASSQINRLSFMSPANNGKDFPYHAPRTFVEGVKELGEYQEIEGPDWALEIGALRGATAELIEDPPMLM